MFGQLTVAFIDYFSIVVGFFSLTVPRLNEELQNAKDGNKLLTMMVKLVQFFGTHLFELCPTPTPTMFDEFCRLILIEHPECADRSFDVNEPSSKWVSIFLCSCFILMDLKRYLTFFCFTVFVKAEDYEESSKQKILCCLESNSHAKAQNTCISS